MLGAVQAIVATHVECGLTREVGGRGIEAERYIYELISSGRLRPAI